MGGKSQARIQSFFRKRKHVSADADDNPSFGELATEGEVRYPVIDLEEEAMPLIESEIQISGTSNFSPVRIGGRIAASGRPKKQYKRTRKYDASYLRFGFIQEPGSEFEPRPLCIVCSECLSNEGMKPSKLQRHRDLKHPDLACKPLEYFQRMRDELKQQQNSMRNMTLGDNNSQMRASYLISLEIAKNKKAYVIGEELIKPCILLASQEVIGHDAYQKLRGISLSRNTVKRRIEHMADNIQDQIIDLVKKSTFYSIQIDESTDLTIKPYCIPWKNCIGVCTDGAANMTGRLMGFTARVKKVGHPNLLSTHCIIHREQLVAKRLSPQLHSVLSDVVRIVNEIRCKPLNSRIFEALCEEMGSQFSHLLLHAEVRWLSRGRVLNRLLSLLQEVKNHLSEGVVVIVREHLQTLMDLFGKYYPEQEDPRNGSLWILDPFTAKIDDTNLCMKGKESLLDLASDASLQMKFHASLSRAHFWLGVGQEYPMLSAEAMKILVQFSTTYLCEKTFSSVTAIKTRYRTSLEMHAELRLGVTNLAPQIDAILSSKQAQVSH
ncbi:SCAN domain-containing protein 3-like [Galendromus occidentalis]|uniref:SCAN domain-containing protein 3-like n=1 Tax=Galendromus occidentalis TaxID=34638 RepID=A0AAJ7WII6_9ACAR|nr:SCAN domain-containing protein 3-like [Galendromus occidentalis]